MEPPSHRKKYLLNGIWFFQPTPDDGLPASWDHTIMVPSVVDCGEPRCRWQESTYFWYRTTFDVPSLRESAFVVLEQAMFGTDVWLNGKHLGGDIACYTSQEYDARSALKTGVNELIVRVGRREHLPPQSAVGKDQERSEWIPGVWGDVYVIQCDNPRIALVQVLPHIKKKSVEARITIDNFAPHSVEAMLATRILERRTGAQASPAVQQRIQLAPKSKSLVTISHELPEMHLWSPDDPFLYELEPNVSLLEPSAPKSHPRGDSCVVCFGMREFTIEDGDFYLNGKRIFLKGSNIAFHRFLSDADRGTLPWNLEWVKKVLIDIPKAHNFNFFRNHLGQLYNRWYDIADEYGMLLQNEWMFWTTTGSKEQIACEFTRWLQDNWNHPSIVIWDALNECSDDVVQEDIVPAMKTLDPTRPWESVDFVEEHPYIYSLGPVLNDRTFGFTRALEEIERSLKPTMLNEFCWWWLDKDFNPSSLMAGVIERWLGPRWTKEQVVAHQSFLVTELVELFRRMRVDAIQPFVYLSNNAGPTAHWFVGNIADIRPKPILAALKNAFSPFGVSIELWDRHFFPSEFRAVRVFVCNDETEEQSGTLRYGIVNASGEWLFEVRQAIAVAAGESASLAATLPIPARTGTYGVRAEILREDRLIAYSEKPAFVCAPPLVPRLLKERLVAVLAADEEMVKFLADHDVGTCSINELNTKGPSVLLVGLGKLLSPEYQSRLGAVTKFLHAGKTIVVVEPEWGVRDRETVSVALGLELEVCKREDKDKGGYDSYVFAEDETHPLWSGILPDHLKMFNGAYGGEVVSQHDVTPSRPMEVLARCGLGLMVPAVFEVPMEKGRVIVSRLQMRGRLVPGSGPDHLFARRPDPVLQRYLINLLVYATEHVGD
ncbi:MAG: hypothetical protein C4326_12770 [Ignavibacteria bacterium]